MDGRRRQGWDNNRRSENRKPPRGSWKPSVPTWEKDFCKDVGSVSWESFLYMKEYSINFYPNVMEWDDTAGEEAFINAKKRYLAERNGLSCDISLPDPDLYIDTIDWDSEIDPELLPDLESEPVITDAEEDHSPVIIFGDSLKTNQPFICTGWGDEDKKLDAPAACSSANHGYPWGNSLNGQATWPDDPNDGWQGYPNDAWQGYPNNAWQGYPTNAWQGYPNNGWQGYPNDAWQYGDGRECERGYTTWGDGWNNESGWNDPNNYFNYWGPDMREMRRDGYQGHQNDSNVATTNTCGYASGYKRAQGNEERRNHTSRNGDGHRNPPYSRRHYARDRRSAPREYNAIAITPQETLDQE